MEAEKVYHLVHIWFDPGEHEIFEQSLYELITGVRDQANTIISFVDIPDSSTEKPNKARRIIDLDLFMADYFSTLFNIYFFREFWTPIHQSHLGWMLARIPTAIKDFIRNEIPGIPVINEDNLLLWLSDADFEKIRIVSDSWYDIRLDLLQKARRKFLPNNSYVYPKDIEKRDSNEWRRKRLEEYAIAVLWSYRVHQTYMPDGGFFYTENVFLPQITQDETAYEMYNSYLIRLLINARCKWLIHSHRTPYENNWWHLMPEALHIIAGEYRDHCVTTFAKVAKKTLGYSNISIDEKYTLQKDE